MVRPAAPEVSGPHLEPEDARQGQVTGHMRWVLVVSLVLAIAIIFGVWAFLAERAHADARALVVPPASADRIQAL